MALSIKQTTMTLSERFRILRAQALSREQSSLLVDGSGLNVVDVSMQPAPGQKLANQSRSMKEASRSAVRTALRLKNRSIKQRLGIKNRLGPPVSSFDTYGSPANDFGTSILAMDQVPPPRPYVRRPYVQSTYHHGNQSTFNRFGGRFGRGNFRPYFGQKRFPFQPRNSQNNGNESFKWINPNFGRRGFKKNGLKSNRGFRRNTGGSKFWRNRKPNKEQLDNDIDQFMSKTRSNLNSDLDVYMSQINS